MLAWCEKRGVTMLTVKQAAGLLGVSQARVRKMIADGILPAEKFGSSWTIPDTAVYVRAANKPQRGRPQKSAEEVTDTNHFDIEAVSRLYQEFKDKLSHGYDINALLLIPTTDERELYIDIADFFLRLKQRILIARGVF